jgi:hypothetical protein
VPIDDTVIFDEFEIDGIRCESSPDFAVPRHQWDQALQDIMWTTRNHRWSAYLAAATDRRLRGRRLMRQCVMPIDEE